MLLALYGAESFRTKPLKTLVNLSHSAFCPYAWPWFEVDRGGVAAAYRALPRAQLELLTVSC
jgi:hypothetical protein